MLIRHPKSARGNDLYETPVMATLSLLAIEPLPPTILERPAASRAIEVRHDHSPPARISAHPSSAAEAEGA